METYSSEELEGLLGMIASKEPSNLKLAKEIIDSNGAVIELITELYLIYNYLVIATPSGDIIRVLELRAWLTEKLKKLGITANREMLRGLFRLQVHRSASSYGLSDHFYQVCEELNLDQLKISSSTVAWFSVDRMLPNLRNFALLCANKEQQRKIIRKCIYNINNKIILGLNYFGLTELPQIIFEFQEIQEIDVRGNLLKTVPVNLGDLRNLESVRLNANPLDLKEISKTVLQFPYPRQLLWEFGFYEGQHSKDLDLSATQKQDLIAFFEFILYCNKRYGIIPEHWGIMLALFSNEYNYLDRNSTIPILFEALSSKSLRVQKNALNYLLQLEQFKYSKNPLEEGSSLVFLGETGWERQQQDIENRLKAKGIIIAKQLNDQPTHAVLGFCVKGYINIQQPITFLSQNQLMDYLHFEQLSL